MFPEASVSYSVHKRGGGGGGQGSPGDRSPDTDISDDHCSGLYASYWNAFLLLPSATKLQRLCLYRYVPVHRGGGCGCIPACLAGGIPACLAVGLRGGGACSRGAACSRGGVVWRRSPRSADGYCFGRYASYLQ